MHFKHQFAKAYFRRQSRYYRMFEVLAVTGFIWFAAFIFGKHLLQFGASSFPWVLLVPLFLSLGAGFSAGLLSLVTLFTLSALFDKNIQLGDTLLTSNTLGIISCTFLGGLFCSYWTTRLAHVEHLNHYLHAHLKDLSNDYYVLKISHDRLEHSYITKPLSYREAFYELRDQVIADQEAMSEALAHRFLLLLSQFCLIHQMALFYRGNEKTMRGMAYLGDAFALDERDPLVQAAQQYRDGHYVSVSKVLSGHASQYLVVIPLLNRFRDIVGYVVIKDMPFWMMQEENIQSLTVFCEALSTYLDIPEKLKRLMREHPDFDYRFVEQCYSLVRLKRFSDIDSVLVCLCIQPCAEQAQIRAALELQKRSLDYQSYLQQEGNIYVFVILPLSDIQGENGYRNRIQKLLLENFGERLNQSKVLYRARLLSADPVFQQLKALLAQMSGADVR